MGDWTICKQDGFGDWNLGMSLWGSLCAILGIIAGVVLLSTGTGFFKQGSDRDWELRGSMMMSFVLVL